MASQPPYPIDDMQTPDDAPAPETEATSSPNDQSAAPAPEIPLQPSTEPTPVEPVTNADDAADPAATATPSAIPAPAASSAGKSVRGGNMSMRVLSRAMQDLDVVTGGRRAATYDEVDEYVGRSIRTEMALERAALAQQAAKAPPPTAQTALRDAEPRNGSQPDPVTPISTVSQMPPAEVGSQDSDGTSGAGPQSRDPAISQTDDNPASNQPDAAPQDATTGAQASGSYDANFIAVVPGGTGSLTQSFLGKASDPGAAQWLEGFVGQYGVTGVVDSFLQSGTMKDLTAIRDAAVAYASQDRSRTNTKLLADALSEIVDPKDDIVVSARRRPAAPSSRNADNHHVSVQVPVQGNGFRAYGDRHHQYGTQRTIDAISDISQAWAQLHPNLPVQVGEISRNGGGPLPPHHSHRRGTDFDVRPFRIDRRPAPVDRRSPDYDRNATVDFLRFVRHRYPDALILFNDPVAIRQGFSRHWAGHDNHIHIRFR